MSSDPAEHNAQPTNVPPPGGADGLDAEAARFLASIQQRLATAQTAASELKAREAAIAEQARAIEARRAELEAAERELRAEQDQLIARAAGIDEREWTLSQSLAELKKSSEEVERSKAEAAAERDRLIAEGRAAQQKLEAEAKAKAEVLAIGIERGRAALEARRAEVEQSAAQADAKLKEAQAREEELDARERDSAREAAACAAKMNEADAATAAAAARQKKVEQAELALAEREKAVKALGDQAECDRAAIEQSRVETEKAHRAAQTAAAQARASADAAAQHKAELEKREASVLQREQQLRAAQDELERRRVLASQSEAQAGQLEATGRHLREQAEQIKQNAERQVAQWQDKATEAQFQADSAQQQVEKLRQQLEAAQARANALEEETDTLKVLGVNLSPEQKGRMDGLTKRAEIAEQRAATLQEIIDQHSDEVAKAEARYDTVARQLEEAQRVMSSTGDAYTEKLLAWQKQAEKSAAELAAGMEAAQRAQAEADRAVAALKVAQARVAEVEAHGRKREAELIELRNRATVAEAAAPGSEAFSADQRRRLEGELAQREEALTVLANRLLHSEERAVAMQSQLDRLADELHAAEERAAGAAHAPVPHNEAGVVHHATPEVAMSDTRRRRLRRVRDLLAQEHRKVLLAKEALGRHKAEADAVLQQRGRLSQLAQSVQAAEAEANKARARSGAGSVIIAAMITLATVGGISYFGAGILSPSLYAAKATLSAENDGHTLTDQQKTVWMSAHEKLVTDLQVYTIAAEKFQQRGMRELSNPAAVQERFASNLALITDVPGQLTLELRGIGRENTARELETFAGAVTAIANSRREIRGDGLGTTVSKQAEAGTQPLDNKRQSTMLMALGAGLASAFAAAFMVYRVMINARKPLTGEDALDAFERQATVARLTHDRPDKAAA